MDRKALIKERLDHFHIPATEGQLADLMRFVDELEKWNRTFNLVGIKDMDLVCSELLADSFFLNACVKNCRRVIDLGSGSGIIGIPLAILNSSQEILSVDSNLKKIQFQRHVRRTIEVPNFLPVRGRIEMVDILGGDCLVAKAYGTVGAILEAADRHLLTGGLVFIVKGVSERGLVRQGYSLEASIDYSLPGADKAYRLLVYKKIC